MLIMSEIIDVDTAESSGTENHVKKYEISASLKEKLRELPEALAYIRLLEKQIRKQKKKLRKLRAKLKQVKRHDVGTQTETKSIIEEITEAAELATQNQGFVYDEASGMYYDSNSGYYYNAEYGLYYEPNTGTYMTYKQETNTYEFHSRVHVPREIQKEVVKRKKKSKDESKVNISSDLEHLTSCFNFLTINKLRTYASDISKPWPPCMRIIVEQSQVPKIKLGSLHIVTIEGGTLGREGNHSIVLPDINISKSHLKFTYDQEKSTYYATDLGSRNGTILNGKRMSTSKQESDALEVPHGSRIQVGSVVLLCHVHDGYKTCGHCEPGLVQSTEKKIEVVSKATKSDQHKSELKKLRKKFGVSLYEESGTKLASGYTDRAQKRRETVGSQNPHEKTEVASLDESISAKNKGFKMLEKMGWKEGQSLGKDSQGLLEPVKLVSNPGTSGMGSGGDNAVVEQYDKNKQIIWKKTQERFKKLPTTTVSEVFELSD
ncbi:angiogenic factor with G patch and FHA domains 1 isoform X3 [Tribolium castaneum]|uniref:angiogenic factor with G patch and FHA domains 1 isoform X3 n=1 Tax=Tribolium castaneum TaxID=7070 RepID=UPI0030FE076B